MPAPTHTLIIIHPDGTETREFCFPTLAKLQEAVGGYIETVGFFTKFEGNRCEAFADEEGLLKDKPLNEKASLLWRRQYHHATSLVGPIVIKVKGNHTANAHQYLGAPNVG